MVINYFNPRSREGSDRHFRPGTRNCVRFQSTLPRRERLYPDWHVYSDWDFNPRSREGSDSLSSSFSSLSISIHAPAKGATCQITSNNVKLYISIHAPAKGATLNNSSILSTNFYFNPRSREGSDKKPPVIDSYFLYFNPRSREGSDIIFNRFIFK